MSNFENLIILFIQLLIFTIFITSSGFYFRKLLINKNYKPHIEYDGLFGFILIGFVSLFLNFFVALDDVVNSVFFILILLLSINSGFFNQDKKIYLKKSILISFLALILIIFSTVNRPDAWLYHLPYSKILNEHEIIIGVSNIHSRFSHISIFQYISSFSNNFIFYENGLLIPISLVAIFSFFLMYYEFKNNFNIKNKLIYSYIIYLILIISLYTFNRYSEYGNDAQVHLYYFIFLVILFKFLQNKNDHNFFKELSIISLFLFLIKPTFIFVSLISLFLFFFIKRKKKLIKSAAFIFYCMFLTAWLLKNFLTSGCIIYPLKISCFNDISWKTNSLDENILVNEAWSKGWPDLGDDRNIEKSDFVKNFIWLETWSQNHFLFILKKIFPVLMFLILNFLLFYFTKNLKKNNPDKNLINFFLFSIFFLVLWFIKFPVYRLGISQINLVMIFLFYFIFIKNIKLTKNNFIFKTLNSFLILTVFLILIKNTVRITENYNSSIIPEIHSSIDQNKDNIKVFDKNNEFIHYVTKNGEMCGYSKSPCNHFKKDLLLKKKFGYKIFVSNVD